MYYTLDFTCYTLLLCTTTLLCPLTSCSSQISLGLLSIQYKYITSCQKHQAPTTPRISALTMMNSLPRKMTPKDPRM
ncbi:hypothetical protein DEU56DRAFT_781020, partial [Suillus clintonianus]|uniref:uncharacterized protein n=1 Tax=Suillus clintonianus TaxID=1904413 RepID=UPI001B882AE0